MSERELHEGLTSIADDVAPVDLYDRALARSRQIAWRRRGGGTVLAVVAVALVGLTWQLAPRLTSAPMPPGSPQPPATEETSATASPEPTPPSSSPGRQDPNRLRNATLNLPAWPVRGGVGPCPTRRITFVEGVHEAGAITLRVDNIITADVAGNPARIGVFSCHGPGEGRVQQALAYRNEGDGFSLMGKLVDTAIPAGGADTSVSLGKISAQAAEFIVEVGLQTVPGSAPPAHAHLKQLRRYAWQGSAFVQTGGPTSFLVDPALTRLSATANRLVFAPPRNGCRTGTITMTVTNDGPQPANDVTAVLIVPGLSDPGGQCQAPPQQGYASYLAPVGSLAPGASKEVTASMVIAEDGQHQGVEDYPYNLIELRVADQRYPQTRQIVLEFQT
jgi:hypothetical protein